MRYLTMWIVEIKTDLVCCCSRILQMTPTQASALCDVCELSSSRMDVCQSSSGFPSVSTLCLGGEVLPCSLIRRLEKAFPNCFPSSLYPFSKDSCFGIFNLYGLTEVSVWLSAFDVCHWWKDHRCDMSQCSAPLFCLQKKAGNDRSFVCPETLVLLQVCQDETEDDSDALHARQNYSDGDAAFFFGSSWISLLDVQELGMPESSWSREFACFAGGRTRTCLCFRCNNSMDMSSPEYPWMIHWAPVKDCQNSFVFVCFLSSL